MKLIHVGEPEHEEKNTSKKIKTILKIKPDIILFELPQSNSFSLSHFNKYAPYKKPTDKIKILKQNYKIASQKYSWLKSEYKILEAIEQLWEKGKQIYLFEIDAPIELTSAGEQTRDLSNIAWSYLREKYMVQNIKNIKFKNKNKVSLIFCHNIHWKNIQFLLKNPDKNKIWDYYFINKGITKSPKEIQQELKDKNKTLYKYWRLKWDF